VCKARDRLRGALVALLVQLIILVVACLSTTYVPESSTVPVVPSVQGVAEPL
jgi:hypothetical protein